MGNPLENFMSSDNKTKVFAGIIIMAICVGVMNLPIIYPYENTGVSFVALNNSYVSIAGTSSVRSGYPIVQCLTDSITIYNSTGKDITADFDLYSNCEVFLTNIFYNNTVVLSVYYGKVQDSVFGSGVTGIILSLVGAFAVGLLLFKTY